MAFDERLAERIRGALGRRKGVAEKKMFGGIGFLVNGNMCVGIHGRELIVRIPPENTDAVLKQANNSALRSHGAPDARVDPGEAGRSQDSRAAGQMDRRGDKVCRCIPGEVS